MIYEPVIQTRLLLDNLKGELEFEGKIFNSLNLLFAVDRSWSHFRISFRNKKIIISPLPETMVVKFGQSTYYIFLPITFLNFLGVSGEIQNMTRTNSKNLKHCKYSEKVTLYYSAIPTAYDEAFLQTGKFTYLLKNSKKVLCFHSMNFPSTQLMESSHRTKTMTTTTKLETKRGQRASTMGIFRIGSANCSDLTVMTLLKGKGEIWFNWIYIETISLTFSHFLSGLKF